MRAARRKNNNNLTTFLRSTSLTPETLPMILLFSLKTLTPSFLTASRVSTSNSSAASLMAFRSCFLRADMDKLPKDVTSFPRMVLASLSWDKMDGSLCEHWAVLRQMNRKGIKGTILFYRFHEDLTAWEYPHVKVINIGHDEVGILFLNFLQVIEVWLNLRPHFIPFSPFVSVIVFQIWFESFCPGHPWYEKVPNQGVFVTYQRLF